MSLIEKALLKLHIKISRFVRTGFCIHTCSVYM